MSNRYILAFMISLREEAILVDQLGIIENYMTGKFSKNLAIKQVDNLEILRATLSWLSIV